MFSCFNLLLFLNTDQVKVFLTDDGDRETKCYGYVKIQSDKKKRHVCGNDWTEKEYEMVCKELKCGKVSLQG